MRKRVGRVIPGIRVARVAQAIIIFSMLLICISLTSAVTYYVSSSSGSDSNEGTSQSSPIKTIAKLESIRPAAGSTVLFKRGDVWRESFRLDSGFSGTSSAWTTIGSYGSGDKPIIMGSTSGASSSFWTKIGTNQYASPNGSFTSDPNMIYYNTVSKPTNPDEGTRKSSTSALTNNWDFYYSSSNKRVIIYHSGGNPATQASGIEIPAHSELNYVVFLSERDHIIFKDLDIRYGRMGGLKDYLGSDLVFSGLTFKFIYSSAFTTEGSNNVVINNSEVYYSGISGKLENSQGENFWIADTDNTLIQNNKIYYPSAVPINLWHTRKTRVIGNTVSNCDFYPDSWHAGIYFDACHDSIAQSNVVTNCALGYQVGSEVSGSTSSNISFLNNIANKCKTSFIINSVQNKITNSNIVVRKNTFYREDSPAGFLHDVILQYYNGLIFKENIIANSETTDFSILKWENAASMSSNTDMDYNLWYSGGNYYKFTLSNSNPDSFSEFKSTTGEESHGKTGNPLFTSASSANFKPQTGSPACTMSSTGSYVGAVACSTSSNTSTNNPPTQSKPLLRASDYPANSTNADLYCYNQSTADADGDRVVNKYRWFRNNTYISTFDNASVVDVDYPLNPSTWVCEVTPHDGKVYGASMNSSPLYIRASPVCGDKACNGNENCSTCGADCGSCPVPAYCGDKICNGKENCSTCPGDCGTCVLPKITGCVLEDVAWDENTALKRVYNLSTCFNDPLKTTLTYSVRGNKQVKVTITRGIVDFSSPTDWTGVEHVVFTATSGTRSATTNNITLTVNHAAVCGDDVCEDDMGETCTSCASDCGTCPKPKSSGGGGGGGGGSSIVPTTSITDENSNETDNETAEAPSVIITDTFGPDGNIIPPLISEPGLNEEPALTETSSNLETATSLGLEETAQATASAVSEPIEPVNTLSNIPSTNNNLVPIVFVTLALILVAPGIYLISKNHEQLLAGLKKVHKVVLYEDDASGSSGEGSNGNRSFSDYVSMIQNSFVLAIDKGKSSVTQLIVRLRKPNKIVYYEDDAPETVHHDYFARLHELVSTAISRGYDKLLVASKLRESGWSEDIIEGVLDKHDKEFVIKTLESSGLDAKHADALHHYVKKALEKGHEWTRIATDLLRVGWTSKVVDCLLKTYCDTSLSFLPTFNSSGLEERIA